MKGKILASVAAISLAAGYVVNDNEFRLAFDRTYTFPHFLTGANDNVAEKEYDAIKSKGIEFLKGLNSEYITIRNDQNNVISATFVPSKNNSKKFVILSHGYRSDGLHEFGAFIPFYYEEGVNLIIVDHQGHGRSEGKYITFGYQESIDLMRWIHYIVQTYGDDIEVYLHGISMGAAITCMVSGDENLKPQVKGMICECAYANAKEQLCKTMESFHTPLKELTYKLISQKLKAKCNVDIDTVIPEEAIKNCKIPTIFIHGMADDFVPTNNGVRLFDACGCSDKDLILVDKADHAKSYWYAKDQYQQAILEILNK